MRMTEQEKQVFEEVLDAAAKKIGTNAYEQIDEAIRHKENPDFIKGVVMGLSVVRTLIHDAIDTFRQGEEDGKLAEVSPLFAYMAWINFDHACHTNEVLSRAAVELMEEWLNEANAGEPS